MIHPDAQRAYDELIAAGLCVVDPKSPIGHKTTDKAWSEEEGTATLFELSDRAFSTLMLLLDYELAIGKRVLKATLQ
jgi:hypothetical protein